MRLLRNNVSVATTLAARVPVAATSDLVGWVSCAEFSRGIFLFSGLSLENTQFTYQVTGWFEMKAGAGAETLAYIPIPLAAGTATLGATAVGDDGLIFASSPALIVDTLTDSLSSVRARVMSPADDTMAYLEVDLSGLAGITIETKTGSSSSNSVAFQPDDMPFGGMGDIELAAGDVNIGNVDLVQTAKTLTAVSQFVAAASTAEALVSSSTEALWVGLFGKQAAGDNVGNVFIGAAALDQGVAEGYELSPGGFWDLAAPAGTKFDLNDIYIDADNNDDGVVGLYTPA